jgi:sec-independent protein translocase protein TatA
MGLSMLGPTEVILIIGVALLLFGPGRIAGVGKSLGEGIRLFKTGLRGDEPESKEVVPVAEKKPRVKPTKTTQSS